MEIKAGQLTTSHLASTITIPGRRSTVRGKLAMVCHDATKPHVKTGVAVLVNASGTEQTVSLELQTEDFVTIDNATQPPIEVVGG